MGWNGRVFWGGRIFESPSIISVVDGQIILNKSVGSISVPDSGEIDRMQKLKSKEVLISSGQSCSKSSE